MEVQLRRTHVALGNDDLDEACVNDPAPHVHGGQVAEEPSEDPGVRSRAPDPSFSVCHRSLSIAHRRDLLILIAHVIQLVRIPRTRRATPPASRAEIDRAAQASRFEQPETKEPPNLTDAMEWPKPATARRTATRETKPTKVMSPRPAFVVRVSRVVLSLEFSLATGGAEREGHQRHQHVRVAIVLQNHVAKDATKMNGLTTNQRRSPCCAARGPEPEHHSAR